MTRGIAFLFLWLVIAAVLGGVFVPPTPGGESWPFYIFVASIPVGALLYARFKGRPLVVVCYGLLGGVYFAGPIFDDGREISAGIATVESIVLMSGFFALAMSLICSGAYLFGRRRLRDGPYTG